MRKFYFLIKFGVIFLILLSIGGGIAFYLIYQHYAKDLPKLDSLRDYNPKLVTEVFADDGTKIGEFWKERRFLLQPAEIPDLVKKAIIAGEDKSFMDHAGIDYIGIIRAMIENFKAGKHVQGASTITQQVVKTFVLSPERTYERKIKEAILAKRLEEKFNKETILYLYLNQIYFGNRAYGIEAAAQNYFRKHAKDLNAAEAALIAGLIKAPGDCNPINRYACAKDRQKYVLKRMHEEGYITATQMQEALHYPLKIFTTPLDKEFSSRYAPWFVEEVRRKLIEQYGEKLVYEGGLKVYTTVDLKAQKAADNAVLQGLNEIHRRHGYMGPVSQIKPEEFENFFKQVHKQIYLEKFPQDLALQISNEEKIKSETVTLQDDKIYLGVITDIDRKTNRAAVQVGYLKGYILPKDFGWARKHNPNSHGYDGGIYVRDPRNVFAIGDVVEVKIIRPDLPEVAEPSKKRRRRYIPPSTYEPNTLYFSLQQTPKIEGALFSYEVETGYVRAVVGGKDFRKSEFNRATQALRQTGSVFKPLLYAAALDKGYKPETTVYDSPVNYEYAPGKFWEPKNYGGNFSGPMSFRSALVHSRNVVSVRILMDVGLDYTTAYIRKLGVTTPIDKVYPMALGANDMKLEEVSRAFGVFPTGGILPNLIYVKKITDRTGKIFAENKPAQPKDFREQIEAGEHKAQKYERKVLVGTKTEMMSPALWEQGQKALQTDKLTLTSEEEILLYGNYIPKGYTISPRTAHHMVNIMHDIVRVGTGYTVTRLKRPAAGKTGTTNGLTDCWFVGYTPTLVAGVWTGYDENKYKVGGGETGGKAAAPIFLYYMQNVLEGTPIAKFETPKQVNDKSLTPPVKVGPGSIDHMIAPVEDFNLLPDGQEGFTPFQGNQINLPNHKIQYTPPAIKPSFPSRFNRDLQPIRLND